MSDRILRANLIRLASEHPEFRRELIPIITAADFKPDSIGETVNGPAGGPGSDAKKPWAKGEFTQQENVELLDKQEDGSVADGKADDAPMKVARAVFRAARLAGKSQEEAVDLARAASARNSAVGTANYAEYLLEYEKLAKKYPRTVLREPLSKAAWEKLMGREEKNASVVTAKLHSRQDAILRKYLEWAGATRAATDWDELPDSVRAALRRVKDHETLHFDVNRWFSDNNPVHLRWARDRS